MTVGSLKELYLGELGDLYDAEMQNVLAFPRLAEASHTPELRQALYRLSFEARLHLERLDLIFTHWGESRQRRHCLGLAGIVQEANDRLHDPETESARDAVVVGASHRISHYIIAAYSVAVMYARWLNRPDDARLLEETLEEEARGDRRVTGIAEARIEVSAT
jgi:ferritin-like metal-binding protein YciE